MRHRTDREGRQLMLAHLQKRISHLQNQADFIEILVQFWPLPNMSVKMTHLRQRIAQIDNQRRELREQTLRYPATQPRRFA